MQLEADATPLLYLSARRASRVFLVALVIIGCVAVTSIVLSIYAISVYHQGTKEGGSTPPLARCPDDVYGSNGIVASFHPLATQAGITILKQGGNAYDAAAAVQFALTVVEPHMSGIGGGCFILFYNGTSKSISAIDGREEAPATCSPTYFCKNPDNPTCAAGVWPFLDRATGGLPVGVPGTVDAINRMLTEHGTMTIQQVIQPAITIADEGFAIDKPLADSIASNVVRLALFNDSAKLYLRPDGTAKVVGDIIKNPDLANTFRALATQGRDYFYTGALALDIVNAVRNSVNPATGRAGNIELSDLASYKAVYRYPTQISYRGKYDIYGMNSPGSGGLTMGLMLNIIEGVDFSNVEPYSVDHVHILADVQNIAFADRNQYIGDADFVDVPVSGILDKGYARLRRALLDLYNALPTPVLPGRPPGAPNVTLTRSVTPEEHGTTQFITADRFGNVVSITSTIELAFGAAVTVPGRGFVLNNELTDFDAIGDLGDGKYVANGPDGGKKPRRTAIGADSTTMGGKRPRSSMTPTLVIEKSTGKPVIALGAPGGSQIIGHVFNTLHKLVDYDMCLNNSMAPPYAISRNEPIILPSNTKWWEEGYDVLVAGLQARGFATPATGTEASHVLAIKIKEDGSYIGGPNQYYRSSTVEVY